MFIFTSSKGAVKRLVKGKWKRMSREGEKHNREDGDVHATGLGKKRATPSFAQPTDSDLILSFKNASMDSGERMLFGEMNVSSKRVCGGRVETVWGKNGEVTHVSKEIEEKEDEYEEGRRESVGEDRAVGTDWAASGQEDRRE